MKTSFESRIFEYLRTARWLINSQCRAFKESRRKAKEATKDVQQNALVSFLEKLKRSKSQDEFDEILKDANYVDLLQKFSYGPIKDNNGNLVYQFRTLEGIHPNVLVGKQITQLAEAKAHYTSLLEQTVILCESFFKTIYTNAFFNKKCREPEVEEVNLSLFKRTFENNELYKSNIGFFRSFNVLNAIRNCYIHNDGYVNERNYEQALKGLFNVGDFIPMKVDIVASTLEELVSAVFSFSKYGIEQNGNFSFYRAFVGEYVLVYYEFGAKEALSGFRRLVDTSLLDKAGKLYSTALYLLCLKECGETKAYNDNLSLLDEYSDLKQKEFYRLVLSDEREKALALYNAYSDSEKGLFGVLNPFVDAVLDVKA